MLMTLKRMLKNVFDIDKEKKRRNGRMERTLLSNIFVNKLFAFKIFSINLTRDFDSLVNFGHHVDITHFVNG